MWLEGNVYVQASVVTCQTWLTKGWSSSDKLLSTQGSDVGEGYCSSYKELARDLGISGCFAAARADSDCKGKDKISFGNTIKTSEDIAFAYRSGIRLFAADSEEEIAKLSE